MSTPNLEEVTAAGAYTSDDITMNYNTMTFYANPPNGGDLLTATISGASMVMDGPCQTLVSAGCVIVSIASENSQLSLLSGKGTNTNVIESVTASGTVDLTFPPISGAIAVENSIQVAPGGYYGSGGPLASYTITGANTLVVLPDVVLDPTAPENAPWIEPIVYFPNASDYPGMTIRIWNMNNSYVNWKIGVTAPCQVLDAASNPMYSLNNNSTSCFMAVYDENANLNCWLKLY